MFAGRYLWWGMVSIAGFLFFAVYFDYVSWAIIQGLGCERSSNSCGPLVTFLLETAKPYGFWLAGAILFVCTIARIHYLKLNPLWDLVVAVWFLATGPFPMLFTNIWHGELQFQAIVDALPVQTLFLAAFGAYLALPFEEDDGQPFGTWQPLRYVVALATAYSVLLAMSDNSAFPAFLSTELGLTRLAGMIADVQPQATFLLQFGRADNAAAYIALSLFVACMFASIVPRWRIAGVSPMRLTPTESPRRR